MAKSEKLPASASGKRIDHPTGTETVGHEWDGIEELNTPLPRWWLLTFYITVFWALVYVVIYPAIPLLTKGTEGLSGWSSRGQLADEIGAETNRRAQFLSTLASTSAGQLQANPQLMQAAVAGGRAAFRVNCVACHGAGAAGSTGYPNLNDDDWLWGGNLAEIEYTITHGIRQPGHAQTRQAQPMPRFGKDGILTANQIADVTSHVRVLGGKERPGAAAARGAALFTANCAVCHGPDGKGNREKGAPNLTDAIWLHGDGRAAISASIARGPAGVMPAWQGKLDPVTIRMLAAYVHSLGGGEDFAATPTPVQAAADARP